VCALFRAGLARRCLELPSTVVGPTEQTDAAALRALSRITGLSGKVRQGLELPFCATEPALSGDKCCFKVVDVDPGQTVPVAPVRISGDEEDSGNAARPLRWAEVFSLPAAGLCDHLDSLSKTRGFDVDAKLQAIVLGILLLDKLKDAPN